MPTLQLRAAAASLALACAAGTLTLAGCATTAARSTAPVAPYVDTLAVSGRLAVNYSRDGKPESLSFPFEWEQTPHATDVSLLNPLGNIVAKIKVTPDAATLTEAGKAPRMAADIDSLSAQTLGWSLPVSGLRDWLQGYATARDGSRFAASPAKDTVLTRDGWQVRFVSWQDENAAVPKPKRIDVTRIAASQVDELNIRIVINPPPGATDQ